MTKFKVGDRVRVQHSNNNALDGRDGEIVGGARSAFDWTVNVPPYGRLAFREAELESLEPETTDTETTTTVTHYWRVPGDSDAGWGYCYDEDIEFFLSVGQEVKRVTTVHTKTTEYLEPDDE